MNFRSRLAEDVLPLRFGIVAVYEFLDGNTLEITIQNLSARNPILLCTAIFERNVMPQHPAIPFQLIISFQDDFSFNFPVRQNRSQTFSITRGDNITRNSSTIPVKIFRLLAGTTVSRRFDIQVSGFGSHRIKTAATEGKKEGCHC